MSRHGYVDDLDQRDLAMWRGRVASAIRGNRGQTMLRELRDALDSMPEKRLITRVLQRSSGECCTLGRLATVKGMDYTEYEDDEYAQQDLRDDISVGLNVSPCLVQEVEYENDEGGWNETPEQRWTRMRAWVERQLKGNT